MRRTRSAPFVFLPVERDGRLGSGTPLDRIRTCLASLSPPITDAFVFCPGWLADAPAAKAWAGEFFDTLQASLALLRDRIVPLRIALHWPSHPFAQGGSPRGGPGPPLPERGDGEIPLGPEEEAELDALRRRPLGPPGRVGDRGERSHALNVWLTKKRAGEVGERFGREHLASLWAELPGARRPRLHLIGHSFGARLLTSAVLGGARPESLVLLQAAFSAFAFAEEVPGARHPGLYHRVLAEPLVTGRLVALRSTHDALLTALYPILTGASRVDRPGRLGRMREIVAASGLGVVGVRGVGAPEVEILPAQRLGLPLRPVVNVEASRVIKAHHDILHPEVATTILMASGWLVGGPDGPRPRAEAL